MAKQVTKKNTAEDKINLELKQIELDELKKKLEEWEPAKLRISEDELKISKIDSLRMLLESYTVTTDGSIINNEPTIKPVFTEEETYIIKDALFRVVHNLK